MIHNVISLQYQRPTRDDNNDDIHNLVFYEGKKEKSHSHCGHRSLRDIVCSMDFKIVLSMSVILYVGIQYAYRLCILPIFREKLVNGAC